MLPRCRMEGSKALGVWEDVTKPCYDVGDGTRVKFWQNVWMGERGGGGGVVGAPKLCQVHMVLAFGNPLAKNGWLFIAFFSMMWAMVLE